MPKRQKSLVLNSRKILDFLYAPKYKMCKLYRSTKVMFAQYSINFSDFEINDASKNG